jgi:LPPG:FO 2-phospho-L-lactate transferase
MVTYLAGGTGTPKLLWGGYDAADAVVANTGDDVLIGDLYVAPDLDSVLFGAAGLLDTDRWWGIDADTTAVHEQVRRWHALLGVGAAEGYLPADLQRGGPRFARWRRYDADVTFIELGDRDRALHAVRAAALTRGDPLSTVTTRLCEGLGIDATVAPMTDDPVATIIHTDEGPMHLQTYWVGRRATPTVRTVEYRGATAARVSPTAAAALRAETIVIGPANPITSIGPILQLEAVRAQLRRATVVVVSPFIGAEVFSGPAAALMRAMGYDASTAGVAAAYPFADAFVLDTADPTDLGRPVVRTDIGIETPDDAARVRAAVEAAATATQ